ncbi:50S ribosomal protein L2 [Candidatus Burarchaeum australiense]|nr:50S ribosomal protein L2 [Candidatus Burarchaeum australiense]
MGKPLTQQRRGKGSPSFRRPSHRFKADVMMRGYDQLEREGVLNAKVLDFVDDPARTALLMEVLCENGEKRMLIAPEGIQKGGPVQFGVKASVAPGNALPLSLIPDGTPIYNIESAMGDGGKFVRSAGTTAFIISHEEKSVMVRMPSKQVKEFDPRCRAQIGVVCGGGLTERPMMKAGVMHYKAHARNLYWPHVRGVAMNAVDHPYGGGQHHAGKPTTTARGTPPGRNVGHLAARTTGRLSAAKQELKKQHRKNR